MVSVRCTVYNHEAFLRKCLEGFVMQKTTFRFEVFVHDDASTDNSPHIIREYAQRYPDIIKPFFETENQYSKNDGQFMSITYSPLYLTGKYLAICEGDDYWTDPLKLQKQVDYLENHPGCSLCCHNATLHWYDNRFPDKPYTQLEDRDYTAHEIICSWETPATASFVFRSSLVKGYLDCMEKHPGIIIGDIPLLLHCSKQGSIHAFSDTMSVYGKHNGGWTQSFDAEKMYAHAYSWEMIREAFRDPYYKILRTFPTGMYINAISHALKETNIKVLFSSLYRGLIRHPIDGLKALIRLPKERRQRKNLRT